MDAPLRYTLQKRVEFVYFGFVSYLQEDTRGQSTRRGGDGRGICQHCSALEFCEFTGLRLRCGTSEGTAGESLSLGHR
jgi:hypothetical protein